MNKRFVHGSLWFISSFAHLFVIFLYYTDREQRRGSPSRLFWFRGAIMATSQKATSTRRDYQVQAASSNNRHPDSGRVPPVRRPERNPFDPMRITYTRARLPAGAAAALVGALGRRRFGWPLAAGLGGLGAASLAYMRRFE